MALLPSAGMAQLPLYHGGALPASKCGWRARRSGARHLERSLFDQLQRLQILDQIVLLVVGELPANYAVRIGLLVGIRRRFKGMAEHAVALDLPAIAVRHR